MNVVVFNQRSVAEILQMIAMLGGLVGCQPEAERLADRLEADLDRIRESASRFPQRLRVFFEEWDEPLISGIRWVEELVAIAGGGAPLFPELATAGLARIASSIRPRSRGATRRSSSRRGAARR
jgi:iron complex transport system substrate-binding protein